MAESLVYTAAVDQSLVRGPASSGVAAMAVKPSLHHSVQCLSIRHARGASGARWTMCGGLDKSAGDARGEGRDCWHAVEVMVEDGACMQLSNKDV